ncbi:MAG: hypothetical protein ABIH03_02005 [Pseudomonadota bacterium]
MQVLTFAKQGGWTKASSRKWCKENTYATDDYTETATAHCWQQPDGATLNDNGDASITLVQDIPQTGNERGDEDMSMTKEIAGLKAAVEAITAERDKLTGQLDAAAQENNTLKAAQEALQAELEQAKADAKEKIDALTAEAVERESEAEKAKADLALAKDQLEHPANKDASTAGEAVAAGDGGEATDGDALPHYTKFKELQTEGKAREASAYWEENAADIQAEVNAMMKEDNNNA